MRQLDPDLMAIKLPLLEIEDMNLNNPLPVTEGGAHENDQTD